MLKSCRIKTCKNKMPFWNPNGALIYNLQMLKAAKQTPVPPMNFCTQAALRVTLTQSADFLSSQRSLGIRG